MACSVLAASFSRARIRSAAALAALASPAVPAPATSASILRSFSRSSDSDIGPGSVGWGAARLDQRGPADQLVLEHVGGLVAADADHRLEADPQQLVLEFLVRHHLLRGLVEPLDDRQRRSGGRENAERGLPDHAG